MLMLTTLGGARFLERIKVARLQNRSTTLIRHNTGIPATSSRPKISRLGQKYRVKRTEIGESPISAIAWRNFPLIHLVCGDIQKLSTYIPNMGLYAEIFRLIAS